MELRKEEMGESYQGNLFGEGNSISKTIPDYCSDWNQIFTDSLDGYRYLAVDTETNGLAWWAGKTPFCITAYNGKHSFYINTRGYNWEVKHPFVELLEKLNLENKIELVFANAKFDINMLRASFVRVHDILVNARLIYNDYEKYDLESVAERLGYQKSDAVKNYIKKYRLYDKVKVGGLNKTKNNPRYDLVPDEVLVPYAIQDAKVTHEIFIKQKEAIEAKIKNAPNLSIVSNIENKLIPVLVDMERRGLKIDIDYCKKALSYGEEEIKKNVALFGELTGHSYVNSSLQLSKILTDKYGIKWGETSKGNIELDEDSILTAKKKYPESSEALLAVLNIRDHYKRSYTYFAAYIKLADKDGRIHTSFRQAGTKTGRMSTSDPNLQNLSKNGDKLAKYPVRRCIISSPGKILVSIDYKAFEFCAAVEYAREIEVAKLVAKGEDPHKTTANMMGGVDRFVAKSVGFGLIYGQGVTKLSNTLNCSEEQARKYKELFFNKLPNFKTIINQCTKTAKERGFIFNKFGRRSYFPDPNKAYKAINSLIQGVTADAVKNAMVQIHAVRPDAMLLQIHDEILFEVEDNEQSVKTLLADVLPIMRDAYPVIDPVYRMNCSVSTGYNWGDMEEYSYNEAT